MIQQSASALPLYQKIKGGILSRIESGEFRPGDRVPSENQIVAEQRVSRMTAHRALRELTEEGILTRVPGAGTFVAELIGSSHPLSVRNIADEIRARGHQHSCLVKKQQEVRATVEIGALLRVSPGTPLFYSLLVHSESGTPIQLEERHVLPAAAPEYLAIDFREETPHEYLMRAAPLQRAEHVVRAILPAKRVARWLSSDPAEPCLLVRRRTWARKRPVALAQLTYPGSRYQLSGTFEPSFGISGVM